MDYILRLAWEHLMVPQEELESIAGLKHPDKPAATLISDKQMTVDGRLLMKFDWILKILDLELNLDKGMTGIGS